MGVIRQVAAIVLVSLFVATASAGPRDGRLLGSAGAAQIEGSAGGGLVPWAVIAGYGSEDQHGLALSTTSLQSDEADLAVISVAAGFRNRWEISLARQRLDLGGGSEFEQDVLGAKMRLSGDLIYGKRPQWSLGVQAKRMHSTSAAEVIDNRDRHGVDVYLAVSRLLLDGPWHRHLLLNGTLRLTQAAEIGLLGFDDGWRVLPELSAALLPAPNWALGIEYRAMPHHAFGGREDDWRDVFVSWFPNKHFSLSLAAVDLGRMGGSERQRGAFLSVQVLP